MKCATAREAISAMLDGEEAGIACSAVDQHVAAWRPDRALGMRAMIGVAAALLVVTAAIDAAGGRTSLADEAPHLLAVAGWLMLRYLASVTPPATRGTRLRKGAGWRSRLGTP